MTNSTAESSTDYAIHQAGTLECFCNQNGLPAIGEKIFI